MKFRIKYIENLGYFSQFRPSFPFSRWKTIGKHTIGFGLYPENDIDHPILEYDEDVKNINNGKERKKITHIYIYDK